MSKSGVGSGNLTCTERYTDNGSAEIRSDQGNYDVYNKNYHFGCAGDNINQVNGSCATSVGGKNELVIDGSSYKIVGNPDLYWHHAVGRLDEINAEAIAYRSGYNDNRDNFDISSLLPSFKGFKFADIANSVSNQTSNDVKYPDMPEKTGNFLADHLEAVEYDIECKIIRTVSNLQEQLYQATIGQAELAYEKAKIVAETIDDLPTDPKVKEQIKKIKDGSITAALKLPGTMKDVLMANLAHNLPKEDTFDADAYFSAIDKNTEERLYIENMC